MEKKGPGGHTLPADDDKAEGFSYFFFTSVFITDCSTHRPQADGSDGGNLGSTAPHSVSED